MMRIVYKEIGRWRHRTYAMRRPRLAWIGLARLRPKYAGFESLLSTARAARDECIAGVGNDRK